MLFNILIGLIMIAITVSIQGYGSTYWMKYMVGNLFELPFEQFDKKAGKGLILTALFLLLLNLTQALVWAVMYFVLPQITEFESFEKALYFSLVTFTTLGYGDMTIGPAHRLLSGIEAINGILLIGWSTALMYSVMNEIWKKTQKEHH